MIKYTSKDIIERACQLADLQNSDFISDEEKSMLLNEAWVALYQKIVNSGDKSFIKTVSAYNGMSLPSDFYQLSALYVEKDRQQIDKLNASQREGYRIENNVLYLSSGFEDVSVILEYYPTPKTLFYNSGKVEKKNFIAQPLAIVDEKYYVANSGGYKLIDYETENALTDAYYNNDVICSNGRAGIYTFVATDMNGFFKWTASAGSPSIYKVKPLVIKGNTVTYDDVKTDENLSSYLAVVMDESEEILYFIDRNRRVYDRNGNKIYHASNMEVTVTNIFCRNDGLYFNNGGNLYRILGDVVEEFPLSIYNFCCFVDSTYCIVSFNGQYYKMAYGFNTPLLYPNNTYYTVLAYSLAISFKLKQNGDVTALSAKYEEAVNQFFDSISNDANQNYTIKDVYKNGRGRIWS
jgi:hypothetical protein